MHEDLLRDKGIYVAPGSIMQTGALNMPGAMKSAANMGYRIPRKFTLDSLSKMHYSDFVPPNGKDEDEFKPSDVLDSDEDVDEEVLNMYNFKNRDIMDANTYQISPQIRSTVNKIDKQYLSAHNSQVMQTGMSKKVPTKINKNVNSVPMSRGNKKKSTIKVNQSVLLPQKKQGAFPKSSVGGAKLHITPARKRNQSVIHQGPHTGARNRKRSLSKLHPTNAYKSSSKAVSDYSPGRKRGLKLKMSHNKSLLRANQFDAKSRYKQEEKLKNILKMHTNKGTKGAKKHKL